MENRKPGTGDAVPRGGTHRLRWLLAGAVLVIVLILVAAARLSGSTGADPWRADGAGTVGQAAPAAQAPGKDAAAGTASQPARIVDERADIPDPGLRQNPLSRIQTSIADENATGPQGQAPAVAPHAASAQRRPVGSARSARPGPETATQSGNDLLSTLLGIIRQDNPAAATSSPMDDLIAQVLTENERTYNETSAALASLGQPQSAQAESKPARPSRAQRALQSCPAANTVQGINCRDRVCARWAGRDPACPGR